MIRNELLTLVNSGAYRLLTTQKTDGGWQWQNPDTNPAHGIPTPGNTLGVTARGLLDSYGLTRMGAFRDACLKTYQRIVQNASSPTPSVHRLRGPDITFLAELSSALGDVTYSDFARVRYAATLTEFGGGSPVGLAQYLRDARKGQGLPAIISWDINLYIQGLMKLHALYPNGGYENHAKQMAGVIYTSLYINPVDFDIANETQNEFWNGITGAIEAFQVTELQTAVISSLLSRLIASQHDDGHFIGVGDGSNVQTTAYAIMCLRRIGDHPDAYAKAANYLQGIQLSNGGWKYDGGENTEVTAEAIHSLNEYLIDMPPRCPICRVQMNTRKLAHINGRGVRFVSGYICESGLHDITVEKPKGITFEKDLLSEM